MMSPSLIRSIANHAAYEAAQEDKAPLLIWDAEQDARNIPFLGDYVPAGWRFAIWSDFSDRGISRPRNVWTRDEEAEVYFMVDAGGWGAADEPALTLDQFAAYLDEAPGFGWAIREQGQFQIVVGAYVEDAGAPGTTVVEPDPCEYCGSIHGPLDDCEEHDHDYETEDIADGVVGGGAAHVWVSRCRICGEENDEIEEPEYDHDDPVPGQQALFDGTPLGEHRRGEHEDGSACADCVECASLGWLDVTDEAALLEPEVIAIVEARRNPEPRHPSEVYGTPEHEAWLIEMERHEP